MNTKKQSIIRTIVLVTTLILLSIHLCSIFSVNIFHYTSYLNADISSETVLAPEIWKYKKIVPPSWIPSTEVEIVNICAIAAPLYGLTGNMNLSYGISCCIVALLLIMCFYLLLKSSSIDLFSSLLGLLIIVALPGTIDHLLNLYLLCGYYAVATLIMLFTLNIYIRLLTGQLKHHLFFPILTVILAFLLSLSGMHGMLFIYFPLFVLEFLRWFVYLISNHHLPLKNPDYKKSVLFVILVSVFAFIGTRSKYTISSDVSRNIRHGFQKMFTEVCPAFLECANITGIHGLCNMLMISILIVSISVMILFLIFHKKADRAQFLTLIFFWICLLTVFLSNSFTTAEVATRYYYSYYFIAAYSFACIFNYLHNKLSKNERHFSPAIVYTISAILLVPIYTTSYLNWQNVYPSMTIDSDDSHPELTQIVSSIEDHNCRFCYSSFNNANNLTVISNGKVQGAAIDDFSKLNISKWLTSTDWYCPNADYNAPTAYLMPKYADYSFDKMCSMHNDISIILETDNYILFYSPHNYSNLQE